MVAVGIVMMQGCAQPAPASSALTEKECATLSKKIVQTENFINEIAPMDQSHVEEYVSAVPRTEITTSTNKPRVLKDARLRKAALAAEFENTGCKKEK
jgi:hypothetical protein